MGISHSKRFFYLVIPKTGSTTVRHALDAFRDVRCPSAHCSEHVPLHRVGDEHKPLLERYFTFSFVRNPYDRLYSGYLQDRWAVDNVPHWNEAKRPIFDIIGDDFNRYVRDYVAQADRWNDPFWISFCPMHAFTHASGRQIMKFIGRTEELDTDIRELSRILDLNLGEVKSFNVSTPPRHGLKHLQQYNAESLRLVNDLYAQDFEYFGYPMIG